MAIREFSSEGIPRAKIAFVGDLPTGVHLDRFQERNFSTVTATVQQLANREYARELDAVILTQDPDKLNTLPRQLGEIAPALLDQDVRVYVRIANATGTSVPRQLIVQALQQAAMPTAPLFHDEWLAIPESSRERENSIMLPCVYLFDSNEDWPGIATAVCDRPAGHRPNTGLDIDEELLLGRIGPDGHNERITLLRRAFWNCSELRMKPLTGGLSGAPVFKVYAALDAGLVGRGSSARHPHLYFVKIGPRKKIIDEYDKYCGHVFEYVPFHLGPSLRKDRCNIGSTQGVLVGDFVEGAESLVACARGLRSGHAISNLFDKTLGGWRKQRSVDEQRSLSDYLECKWLREGSNEPIKVPPPRAAIVHDLGGSTRIAELRRLFERKANSPPLIAPAHGDMHATNVLVRHGDAIIIDFEKLEANYPQTYDPASLEGGLLVEGFIEEFERHENPLTPQVLVDLILPLYERTAFRSGAETNCTPGTNAEWYYNAVNQIRGLSWSSEAEPGQYALTLALCLIRKGCNTNEALTGVGATASRAVAFFLGQKVLREAARARPSHKALSEGSNASKY